MSIHKVRKSNVKAFTHYEHRQLFYKVFNEIKQQPGVVSVSLTKKDLAYAEDFSRRVVKAKMKEGIHRKDGNNEHFRWMTGVLGEVALGKHLGVKIHNNEIGDSSNFSIPDLYEPLGVTAGVKTFRIGNFPLTNRLQKKNGLSKNAYPQVFVCVDIENKVAYLLGIATVETLLKNERLLENNRFVKDSTASSRKTAFTSFHDLIPFQDVKSLKMIIETKSA